MALVYFSFHQGHLFFQTVTHGWLRLLTWDLAYPTGQAPKAHFAKARGGSLAGLVAVMLLGGEQERGRHAGTFCGEGSHSSYLGPGR